MPTADFGIVYESGRDIRHILPGRQTSKSYDPWLTPGGIVVFDTVENRDAAMKVLASLGYQYMTPYQDTQGPGLSYAERFDHFHRRRCLAVRRSRRMPRVV